MDAQLITMKDAAAILNVSWQRVHQLEAEGTLKTVMDRSVERRILFRRGDVTFSAKQGSDSPPNTQSGLPKGRLS